MSSSNRPESACAVSSTTLDPVLRNTLRYTISAKEYKLLHDYLIKRSPASIQKRALPPPKYDVIAPAKDDYNPAAVRAAVRVFIATGTGLKLWEIVSTQIISRGKSKPKPRTALLRSTNFRLASSISLMLLFHRLLHRFFSRLRANLLTDNAEPFRRRNPRVSKTLTSRLAPAIGASLAGFALGVYPGDQLRLSVAIYTASRALEWLYNALEDEGWFKHKPSWVGSWMLFPLSIGQLLHAFVFDRDCFPTSIGEFGLKYTPSYVQKRPTHYPSSLAWPGPYQVLDSLAEMAQLKWPQFVSPILHPNNPAPLPATLIKISSITSPAHPSIPNLSCALLHPSTPSCFSAYVTHNLLAFPRLARFFAIVYGLFSIFRYRSFLSDPAKFTNNLAKQVLKITTVLCGAIGTSWASVCLFQNIFPRTFLPRFRIFLGGMLGGMFALVDRGARSNWLYGARTSADSLWKVGVKKRWWKAREAGDVWVFVLSLMIVNVVYELNPSAVNSGVIRKAVGFFRGEGWADKVEQAEEAQQKQVEDPAAEKYGAL